MPFDKREQLEGLIQKDEEEELEKHLDWMIGWIEISIS